MKYDNGLLQLIPNKSLNVPSPLRGGGSGSPSG